MHSQTQDQVNANVLYSSTLFPTKLLRFIEFQQISIDPIVLYSCSFALERLSEDGNSPAVPLTRLLVAGGKFMYIRARHGTPLPQSPSFSELAAKLSDEELRRALDFEISYGSM